MRLAALSLSLASLTLRVCGHTTPPVVPVAAVNPLLPEYGGTVATDGNVVTEVLPLPDGRIAAYVRSATPQAVAPITVTANVVRPNGVVPVTLMYDPTMNAYVGAPPGLEPGRYPIEVGVVLQAKRPPRRIRTPAVVFARTYVGPAVVVAPPGLPIVAGPTIAPVIVEPVRVHPIEPVHAHVGARVFGGPGRGFHRR